jgi:hypothetical protein
MFGCEFAQQGTGLHSRQMAGSKEMSNHKRGRPATPRGAYNPNPPRQFGRIAESDWDELRAACEAAGQSMVEWALPALLRKARRERQAILGNDR